MRTFNRFRSLAVIAFAFLAAPAFALPVSSGVTWNGASFTVTLTNVNANVYSFSYVADFTNFDFTGNTDYIWGINFKPAQGDLTAGVITGAPTGSVIGDWTPYVDTNLSANGCSGNGAQFFCAAMTEPGLSITSKPTLTWTFDLTITGVTDANALVFSAPIRAVFAQWNPNAGGTGQWQESLMSLTTGSGSSSSSSGGSSGGEGSSSSSGNQVPEPSSSLVLLGLGLIGLGFARRMKVRA